MFYFCDPDGHGPYVQCRDAMPVDEYTPKLGSLTMEDIAATDAPVSYTHLTSSLKVSLLVPSRAKPLSRCAKSI